MSFKDAVITALTKKYAIFGGRARRSEFWWVQLAQFLAGIVVGIIDLALDTEILGVVLTLALFIPLLAVGARRLHDTGRSGWWQLLHLVLFFGTIVLIVFWTRPSEPGTNKYGPNPVGEPHFGDPQPGWTQQS